MASRRPMTVSPLWLQGSILTFVVGFSLLTLKDVGLWPFQRGGNNHHPVTHSPSVRLPTGLRPRRS